MEIGIVTFGEQPVRFQQNPDDQRRLLGIEIGGKGQVREVLAVVAGRIVPAPVHVHAALAEASLERQAPIGPVVAPRAALAFEVKEHVREGPALQQVFAQFEGEGGHRTQIRFAPQPVKTRLIHGSEVDAPEMPGRPVGHAPERLRHEGGHRLVGIFPIERTGGRLQRGRSL